MFQPIATDSPAAAEAKVRREAAKRENQVAEEDGYLNAPGRWDFFISHTQGNGDATTLAEGLYYSLKEKGHSVWLDVKMSEKNEAAMREGVVGAKCVIAIITEGPTKNDNYPCKT